MQAVRRQCGGEPGRGARRLAAARSAQQPTWRAAADHWRPGLASRERRAVLAYKWLGSFGTNEALRRATERSQPLVRRRRRRVRLLDSALLSAPPLNAPVIVYRGQRHHSASNERDFTVALRRATQDWPAGTRIEPSGFTSWSLAPRGLPWHSRRLVQGERRCCSGPRSTKRHHSQIAPARAGSGTFCSAAGPAGWVRNVDPGGVARRGGSSICIVVDVDVEEPAD